MVLSLSIREAAQIIGVTSATLRNWEKYGLFEAKRKENGYRYYDSSDLEILKLIKQHIVDENINSKHLTKILSGYMPDVRSHIYGQEVPSINDKNKKEAKPSEYKWKAHRNKLGLTLEEVSDAVGISSSYLSKIENDQANISLDVLTRLAHYYGESMVFFTDMSSEYEDKSLVKKGEEIETQLGLIKTRTMQLSELKNRTMFPTLFIIEPGGKSPDAHIHNGEEFIYVLDGCLDLTLNSEKYMLNKEDSISFKATIKHYWENNSNTPTILLWVHSNF